MKSLTLLLNFSQVLLPLKNYKFFSVFSKEFEWQETLAENTLNILCGSTFFCDNTS